MGRQRSLFFWLLPYSVLTAAGAPYNQTLGIELANLEKAVYCGEDRFNRWDVGDAILHAPQVDRTRVRFVVNKDTQAAAGVGKMTEMNGCFVAFRGTLGDISALLDAAFWLTDFDDEDCPGCKVDWGFYKAYASVRDDIFASLTEFGCEGTPLYLVGHSQGAASLTFLAWDAMKQGYNIAHMYGLESPRPGNKAFADAVQAKIQGMDFWRVAHYQDIVVHLAPAVLGYHHSLNEIYYKKRQGLDYKVCGLEDNSCSDQWWQPWDMSTQDHMWYADFNPCSCSNDSQTPPLPSLHFSGKLLVSEPTVVV